MKLINYAMAAVLFAVAFASMATLTGERFDYETASEERRQEWLEARAATLERAARWFAPSGGGPMSVSMSVDEVVARAEAREIEMRLLVQAPYGHDVKFERRGAMTEKLCRNYVKMPLFSQGVRLRVTFKDRKSGRRLRRLEAGPRICARYKTA